MLGRERSGLDDTKLDAHVKFCGAQLAKVGGRVGGGREDDVRAGDLLGRSRWLGVIMRTRPGPSTACFESYML